MTLGKLRNPALCSHVRPHRMFLSYLRIHPSIKQHAQIFEPVFLWKHHPIVRERILQRRDRLTSDLAVFTVNPFFSAYVLSLFSIVCISPGSLVVNPRSSAYSMWDTVPTARRFETHFDGACGSLFASELESFLSAEVKRALVRSK